MKIVSLASEQKIALTTTRNENPWLEAASEANNDFGSLLKFVKGKWMVGDDVVPDGTEYVAHIDQTVRGWVRFQDGKVIDRTIGKIEFRPPERDELPDNDPGGWPEKDAKGEPRDPWVEQWDLPLIELQSGGFVTFVAGSKGGIGAIGNLCGMYGQKHGEECLPIVALRTRSYKHKQHGRIESPDLPIVGWEGASPATPVRLPATTLMMLHPFEK